MLQAALQQAEESRDSLESRRNSGGQEEALLTSVQEENTALRGEIDILSSELEVEREERSVL